MNEAKEKTALCTSVGADERQSVQNTISSISALDTEINHPDENSPENFEDIMRQMQRMSDPAYLHTVSMNELYETVYQSRPPVIDGLLYSGTYLFAGAPKVGKSFFMAQLAYHISTGQPLWNYEVHQGTVLYLALEDDYQRLQERMSRMFGVEGTDISAFEEEINGDFQNSSESLDEIYRRIQRLTDPHYLHTISMTELYQTAYQSRPPIIDGLLYAGAYILAGAPKIGKSFLVAQIAYHVSTGKALWGCEVHPGTVLYLALEDDFQRIQSRMFMMYGVNDTDRLHFATAAGKLGNGLDEQLENFVREHPDTRLIIIDTMQKIREVGGEAYSYASDYEIIGRLKQFADKHCICVLTVHHTRKQPAGDSFEMISGTTGLLGCADGSLLMQKKKRTALEATIDVMGRDQQDQILYLRKDADTQIWNLEKVENELHIEPPDHVLEAVSGLVSAEQPVWTGSPSALADAVHVGMAANVLSKLLNVKSGRLLDEYHIRYENKVRHEGRRITLTYDTESK